MPWGLVALGDWHTIGTKSVTVTVEKAAPKITWEVTQTKFDLKPGDSASLGVSVYSDKKVYCRATLSIPDLRISKSIEFWLDYSAMEDQYVGGDYIDFTIPEDAKSGSYSGSVKLEAKY